MQKKIMAALLFLLVLVPALWATETGISGFVRDYETAQPIAGAVVCCGSASATTNRDGFYLLADLEPRKYKVIAEAPGYVPLAYPESVPVVEGRVTPNINFYLRRNALPPPGAVQGKVLAHPSGQLIPGAIVKAQGPVVREVVQGTECFKFEGLPPGKYWVSAVARGFKPGCFPESVLVKSGQTTYEVCFHLIPDNPPEFGTIIGMVMNAANNLPIPGAIVRAAGPVTREVRQPEHEGYKIDCLPPGRYWVTAKAEGFEPSCFPESVLVVVGQVRDHIDIKLVPSGTPRTGAITGNVTNAATGRVICQAVVVASAPNITRRVLQTEEGYKIPDLPPGKYWVSAKAEGFEPGCFPESVLVKAGAVTERICFSLKPCGGQEPGQIAGRVINAETREPVPGAVIAVEGPMRGHATSNREGDFLIPGLIPGLYVLEASAPGYLPLRQDSIKVAAGEITRLLLALRPRQTIPGGISGTVKDSATGEPIPGSAAFAYGRAGSGFGFADSTGHYVIRGLPPGAYNVFAGARGYYEARYPRPVEVLPGQVTDGIHFLLRRLRPGDAGISGFVFDAYSQAAVQNARLTAIGESGTWEVRSTETGDYLLHNLAPGEYVLQVEAEGYSAVLLPEPILVEADQITAFVWPALYPLAGTAEDLKQGRVGQRLEVTPNPFVGSTIISWQTPLTGPAQLQIVDNSGRVIHSWSVQQSTSVRWNRTDTQGNRVPAGIYFCRLVSIDLTTIAKIVLR